jgi:hypothetical protein
MIGKTLWVIPEGYIPSTSTGPEPQMTSHETACILNANDKDANVEITIYYLLLFNTPASTRGKQKMLL